jgi:hypothetical protein
MEEIKLDQAQTQEDLELIEAQRLLTAARARKAQAEENARLAAQAALTKRLADEQERLARLQKEAEEIEARTIAKRAAEAERIRQEDAVRAAETRRLEQELAKHNEVIRIENERKERVRQITEAARTAEIEAASLEAALKQPVVIQEELKPPTLQDTPLGIIFGRPATTEAPIKEISAEENARMVREAEAKAQRG